ncbi:MAG: Uma2 family endonuclease [Abditibacteriales bacterium]|nr:Uma2 family endonuclease [Abditibacteriales bacterium]
MATMATPLRATSKMWTDEELMKLPYEGKVELIKGEVVVSPAGLLQEKIGLKLAARLLSHVEQHDLGDVYGSSAGFRPPSADLRAPDVSFVRKERLPGGETPKGFGHFPPDLAVEVFAPDETADDYADKVREYLQWGVRLVWLVDPNTHTVTVCRPDGTRTTLKGNQMLSGEAVVPGFKCRVRTLFA